MVLEGKIPDAKTQLGTYLLKHPEALGDQEKTAEILSQAEVSDADKAKALAELLSGDTLTTQLLEDAGITAQDLMHMMREDLELPADFTESEARLVLGVQYELSLRKLDNYDAYILAEDIDTPFISLLSDGDFAGAKVTSSTTRALMASRSKSQEQ